MMVSTWVEASLKGRLGGPVRAGMWSAVVVGTHPVAAGQEVWLELACDDLELGPLPAFWLENKGINSLWHIPVPPQPVGSRLRYRSAAHQHDGSVAYSAYQEVVVRPNLPDRAVGDGPVASPEGLAGNRMMTIKIDGRGATFDVYFPTVGLHSDVRPALGDQPQSRCHFRAIVGGLAVGRRIDWFSERLAWESYQRYQGATNLLLTDLRWRHGPVRVLVTDFAATGPNLPRTAGGATSHGQYIKRFRIINEAPEPRRALFGLYVHAEVNGGVGEPGLTWLDGEGILLATNRGHGHANRKLARDATVEFALSLDPRGAATCEMPDTDEAILVRPVDLPANGAATIDLLVSGAFTGWRGDSGTFDHWLRPALAWFHAADVDALEAEAAEAWDGFIEPLPSLSFPRPDYAVALRRSALAAALHADAQWGAIAAGFDRGLNAYCWPRDAIWVGGALDRAGHAAIGRGVLNWLMTARSQSRSYSYFFQKYSIDSTPEWETPAVDQTALIPWGIERHIRRTGDREALAGFWPMIEQAAAVCAGESGHPGLRRVEELELIASAGLWDNRFGAFFYSNICVVAGLRAAARLARALDKPEPAAAWDALADRTWHAGILGEDPSRPGAGLFDAETGRFLDARRLSTLRGLWTDRPEALIDRSAALDVSLLAAAVPFGLLPASDPRLRRLVDLILKQNVVKGESNALTCWAADPERAEGRLAPSDLHQQDGSSLATLWMARYLLRLGRETGEAQPWSQAVALLDEIVDRLGPLGLILRPVPRRDGATDGPRPAPGVWALHASLIETVLDFASFEYDADAARFVLEPALPLEWPTIGLFQPFSCGEAAYALERPAPGRYRLRVDAKLRRPVGLDVIVTLPDLDALGSWSASDGTSAPAFDRAARRLVWSRDLPEGESHLEWTWG